MYAAKNRAQLLDVVMNKANARATVSVKQFGAEFY